MATYRGCTTTINPPTQKWNLNLCLSHIAQFPLLRCFGMRFDNEMHCCEKHKLWPAPLQITILPWCPFTSLHWMGLTENRSLASLCLRKDADAETPPHLRSPSHMFFVKNCVWFKLCNASCFCKTLGEIFRGTKKWTLPCFHKKFFASPQNLMFWFKCQHPIGPVKSDRSTLHRMNLLCSLWLPCNQHTALNWQCPNFRRVDASSAQHNKILTTQITWRTTGFVLQMTVWKNFKTHPPTQVPPFKIAFPTLFCRPGISFWLCNLHTFITKCSLDYFVEGLNADGFVGIFGLNLGVPFWLVEVPKTMFFRRYRLCKKQMTDGNVLITNGHCQRTQNMNMCVVFVVYWSCLHILRLQKQDCLDSHLFKCCFPEKFVRQSEPNPDFHPPDNGDRDASSPMPKHNPTATPIHIYNASNPKQSETLFFSTQTLGHGSIVFCCSKNKNM